MRELSAILFALPPARVFNGTLYIYPSHDKDNAYTFDMEDYHVFSTRNMKDFKDCGLAFDAIAETSWAHANACTVRRSVCVDRLYYNPDGTIKKVEMTSGIK